jgi:6-phosphogluconolactonase
MMSEAQPLIYADADALARAAGVELLRRAQESVAARGLFTLALAGGSTPKKLYALLGSDAAFAAFPWAQTHLFFGDERHVPPDHADSNYLMVKNSLLASGIVPAASVHRMRAELPQAAEAAADYDAEMHKFFPETARMDGFPRFDAILLGMGPDGHTASLFPDSPGLGEKTRWVISNPVEKFKTDRITFTFPVLDAARAICLLVAGADKAEMIGEIFVKSRGTLTYPVQRVQPRDGVKIWMLDRAAAAKLPSSP